MVLSLALPGVVGFAAQAPQRPAEKAPVPPAGVAPPSDEALAATREQLIKLLRVSPRLTTVIVRDPSLLSNQEYVSRNNPELAQFLQSHPEIVRNPEFYLFSNLGGTGRFNPALHLEQEVWPTPREPAYADVARMLGVFLFFLGILATLIWLLRTLLDNRRQNRVLRLQTDVHSRLLDKFTTNEDLLAYMSSDAGKRFLETAPFAAAFDSGLYRSNPIAKVVTPVQIGVVLVLLGSGLFYLRGNIPGTDAQAILLIIGTLALMLGLGFVAAAGISWALARHFGLLPPRNSADARKSPGIDTIGR
jgi:hypothetical protein